MKRLLRSSKAWAALAGIIVNVVLLAIGQIDADTATVAITGLIGILVAAVAYEDGQQKKGQFASPEKS